MSWPVAIQSFDERILRVALTTPASLALVLYVFTIVGGGYGLFALVPFALRRRTRGATLWLFLALALTSGAVSSFKALFGRVRPCDALAWCAAVSAPSPGGPSFPSGHAAGAFAFATFVSLRAPRLAPVVLVFAALVAWSRCVLGVHYPTDVAAGALLGSALGAIVARFSVAGQIEQEDGKTGRKDQ